MQPRDALVLLRLFPFLFFFFFPFFIFLLFFSPNRLWPRMEIFLLIFFFIIIIISVEERCLVQFHIFAKPERGVLVVVRNFKVDQTKTKKKKNENNS